MQLGLFYYHTNSIALRQTSRAGYALISFLSLIPDISFILAGSRTDITRSCHTFSIWANVVSSLTRTVRASRVSTIICQADKVVIKRSFHVVPGITPVWSPASRRQHLQHIQRIEWHIHLQIVGQVLDVLDSQPHPQFR